MTHPNLADPARTPAGATDPAGGSVLPPAARRGWLGQRWVRLAAALIGLLILIAPMQSTRWFEFSVSMVDSTGRYVSPLTAQVYLSVWEVRPWGPLFVVAGGLAALLVLVAVVLPRGAWSTGLALVAAAAAATGFAAVVVALSRLLRGVESSAGALVDAARLRAQMLGSDVGEIYPNYSVITTDLFPALLATAILGLVAAYTAWPAGGPAMAAALATATAGAGAAVPWALVDVIQPDTTSVHWIFWPSMGSLAVLSVAATAVLAATAWFAVLRRPGSGALVLALVITGLFVATQVLQTMAIREPRNWIPSSEQVGAIDVNFSRLATELAYSGLQLFFVVAAFLAWRHARARDRAGTT